MSWITIVQAAWFGVVAGVNYALFAAGLTLVFGIMFVLNLAHGELFMLGAILTYVLMTYLGMNFFLAMFITIASVAAFGFVFNRIAIQPVLAKFLWAPLITTIGMSMILLHGILATLGPTAHFVETPFTGITHIGTVGVSTEGIVLFGIGSAAIVGAHLFLRRSRIGKDMQATIQNRVGASLCGINTNRVYDYTLIIASGLAALGGVLQAVLTTADPFMGQAMLLKGFAIVIVAGMGNLAGAAILGVIFGVTESLFSVLVTPYFRETLIYGIMIIVLLLKPEGLFTRRE